MKYFSKEIQKDGYIYKTAGVKARDDVDAILRDAGFKELLIPTVGDEDRKEAGKVKKLMAHFRIRNVWNKETKHMGKGDILVIQYPTIEHSIFLTSVLRDLRKRGVKIYFLIHDLESLDDLDPCNMAIGHIVFSRFRTLIRSIKEVHIGHNVLPLVIGVEQVLAYHNL